MGASSSALHSWRLWQLLANARKKGNKKRRGPSAVLSHTLSLFSAFFSCGWQLEKKRGGGIRQDVGDDDDDDDDDVEARRF